MGQQVSCSRVLIAIGSFRELLSMRRRQFLKIIGASMLAGSSLGAYPYVEAGMLTVTELNTGLGIGRRVVHISDTHLGSSLYSVDSLIDLIEKLDPDMIFHTGDHISNSKAIVEAVRLLQRLAEVSETYTVYGNHDIWHGFSEGKYRALINEIEGVKLLVNESVHLDGFWLLGVNDPYTSNDDLGKALARTAQDPKVLLAHSPQIIGKARGKVELVLAGHTHGGQVRLPLLNSPWVPLPEDYKRYSQGLFKVGGTLMYVTRGVGTVIMPVRFNCPPEVVVMEL